MSSQLARSGIDPDQPLGRRSRAALIVGIATIVLAVWQAFSTARGPINAILALVGFFSQLALIAAGGFCALFAIALAVVWAGRRLSIW
jgi:ABC-type sugar transport system permease subunit